MDNTTTSPEEYSHKINNSDYIFKVTLVSVAGDKSRAQDIKLANIQNLFIEDSLNNFYQQGYIIIKNTHDVIERDTPDVDPIKYYNSAGTDQGNIDAGFLFRGESRDILHVEIMPKLDGTATSSMGSEDGQKFFRMSYDFAIYDTEEIAGSDPDEKYKKIYFWDLYYQLLLEKNVPFSTAMIAQSAADQTGTTLAANADNNERAVYTGLALREFLKAAFPDNEQYPISFSVNIPGVQDPGDMAQEEIDQQNIDWDLGGTEIFFSTPANFKAIDCINYIMSRHVSNTESNFDQCFLQLERYPRQFKFKSLKQYFDEAYNVSGDSPGNLYLETVKIGGNVQQDGVDNTLPYFTPANNSTYFERIGTIKSFSFDNMPGIHSQQRIVPNFVHSYDYENKQFAIDIQRNGIEQAMRTYQ